MLIQKCLLTGRFSLPVGRQVRNQPGDQRRRYGGDHGIGGKAALAGLDAGDAALRRGDAARRHAEMQPAALRREGVHQSLDQRLRAAVDIAEFLLEHRAPGSADAPHARGDPRGRDVAGHLVELQLHQALP
jgi:hypothetical protein